MPFCRLSLLRLCKSCVHFPLLKIVHRDAGVNYAENAMYGEMSQQQSTKEKIDKQGGIDSAVSTDVADAGLKAVK